jgi:hypothetical protein
MIDQSDYSDFTNRDPWLTNLTDFCPRTITPEEQVERCEMPAAELRSVSSF